MFVHDALLIANSPIAFFLSHPYYHTTKAEGRFGSGCRYQRRPATAGLKEVTRLNRMKIMGALSNPMFQSKNLFPCRDENS